MNINDVVKTKFGEEITILEVREVLEKKAGKPTDQKVKMYLAKSGDQNCWFPESHFNIEQPQE